MDQLPDTLRETAATVAALGASAGQFTALDIASLFAAQRSVTSLRRAADTYTAWIAAAIATHSDRALGHAGMAISAGFVSAEALIPSISGSTRAEAAKLVQIGTMLAETETETKAAAALAAEAAAFAEASPGWDGTGNGSGTAGTGDPATTGFDPDDPAAPGYDHAGHDPASHGPGLRFTSNRTTSPRRQRILIQVRSVPGRVPRARQYRCGLRHSRRRRHAFRPALARQPGRCWAFQVGKCLVI